MRREQIGSTDSALVFGPTILRGYKCSKTKIRWINFSTSSDLNIGLIDYEVNTDALAALFEKLEGRHGVPFAKVERTWITVPKTDKIKG